MDSLVIAGRAFRSRLIVGTGKYKSGQETARALEASGAEMVTVAASERFAVADEPLRVAVTVAVASAERVPVVAENGTEVAPAAKDTEAGTVRAA